MSLIEVKGLCKSFGNLEVLKDVSFTVDEGEVVVIIGGSGCGKSVTLRSIELLEKPDKGQIFINGREITAKGADIDSIRREMGMDTVEDVEYVTIWNLRAVQVFVARPVDPAVEISYKQKSTRYGELYHRNY